MQALSGQQGTVERTAPDAGSAEQLYRQGRLHKSRNELVLAERAYREALRLHPTYLDAWISLGILLRGIGRAADAEACQREALRIAPGNFLGLLNLGNALLDQNRREDAAATFREALARNPQSAEAHFNLGKALAQLNEAERGAHFYEALRLNPSYFEAAECLGEWLFDAGRFDMAIATFQHACRLRPDVPGVQLDLANTYAAARKFDEAEAAYTKLLQTHPDYPAALAGLAVVKATRGHAVEARALFDRALTLGPANEQVRFHYAPFLLRAGAFAQGWDCYELRWMGGNSEETLRRLPLSRWQGEALSGKRLLIVCEQGLGDEIMFASIYGEMLREAGSCTIECDQRLLPIFRRSFPQASFFAVDRKSGHWYRALGEKLDALPSFDYWTPAGSLARYRRREAASFPDHNGYLLADAAKITAWRARLAELGPGLKIGISWRGGTAGTWSSTRSLTLEQLRPVLETHGAQFVNLQYGDCRAELDAFTAASGIRIHHWQEAIDDYDETAALVGALDLVISVCTAVVHLGGSLGRPVWVMAPFVPEWRYGQSGPSMIWYPSVRMFRQRRFDDWSDVLTDVGRALRGLVTTTSLREESERDPTSASVRRMLGQALLHQGDPGGEQHLIEALRLDPNDFEAAASLGRYLFQGGSFERAIPALARACELRPELADVRLELADSYLSSRRFDDATREFERVLREHSDRPVALAGLAVVHASCGRFSQARALFEQALARQPDSAWIGFNYALFLLRAGDFARGWELYEVRRRGQLNKEVFARAVPCPSWRGEPLAGKRLLVGSEQGLGDEIMFASLYPELVREAEHCVIECDKRLVGLMRRSFPTATVFGTDRRVKDWNRPLEQSLAAMPPLDYWSPVGTLPLYRRRDAASFPRHNGYLRADAARTQHWRSRLRELGPGLRVGISWRGGTVLTHAGIRSITLDRLQPLLSTPNTHFVSLQYGDCRNEIEKFAASTGLPVHHWQEAIDDYDETAALVCALDVVISVCTAVVHLTGALGRPAWVLAPFVPEWRYGETGPSMIWYPSVRMFRQTQAEDWTSVIDGVTQALRQVASHA